MASGDSFFIPSFSFTPAIPNIFTEEVDAQQRRQSIVAPLETTPLIDTETSTLSENEGADPLQQDGAAGQDNSGQKSYASIDTLPKQPSIPSGNGIPMNPNQRANQLAELPVFETIHRIREEVIDQIDDPYTVEQLRAPRMNKLVLRPMVDKLHAMNDISVVYCLLVNRYKFLQEQWYQAHHQTLCTTRAALCEIVATRILRRYDEDNPGPRGLLLISNILVAGFEPFQNAPKSIRQEHSDQVNLIAHEPKGSVVKKTLTALEIAIISESKTLISSSTCQKVVDAIYQGRVTYTPSPFMEILPDRYKKHPISLYDPRKAPVLNQYRLFVPRTRNGLELVQFLLLLGFFVILMNERDPSDFSGLELFFCLYTAGWTIEQFASMLEHGWKVYSANLWSFLDVGFILIWFVYLVVRMRGHFLERPDISMLAFHILSASAPILIPRLAFNLFSENIVFVSLRDLMANFGLLMLLAVWCFLGFLLSMHWMGGGRFGFVTLSKWMLYLWFGLDGEGIQRSVEFHWLLGPVEMVAFAFLGNTLFLTILVAMLTNTFSTIESNSTAEVQYRRTVLTFQSVKSDAIFAFFPPFNILALLFLWPLKLLVSPRWFHKINVATVRLLNAPLLLVIGWHERRTLWAFLKRRHSLRRLSTAQEEEHRHKHKHWLRRLLHWDLSTLAVHHDILNVFNAEYHPGDSAQQAAEDADEEQAVQGGSEWHAGGGSSDAFKKKRARRESMAPFNEMAEHLQQALTGYGGANRSGDLLSPNGWGGGGGFSLGGVDRDRLDGLEEAMERLEQKLGKIMSKIVGDEPEGNGNATTTGVAGERGRSSTSRPRQRPRESMIFDGDDEA